MGAGVRAALCSGGAALALLGLLSALYLLLYHLRGSASASAALPALHAVRPGAPPADAAAAYPRRSGCVVEAQWEAGLQPGGRLPWSNAGTYDALLLRELAEAGVAPTHGYYVESGAWEGREARPLVALRVAPVLDGAAGGALGGLLRVRAQPPRQRRGARSAGDSA